MRFKLLLILIGLSVVACSSEEEQFNSILEGRSYSLTEFNIEIPVDGNNDGVYSTNLIEEDNSDCFGLNTLGFRDGKSGFLLEYGGEYYIDNLNQQQVGCYVLDYFSEGPNYSVNEDQTIVIIGNNELKIEGDNLTFLTTTQDFVNVGVVLNEDGTITEYEGSITLVFSLNE